MYSWFWFSSWALETISFAVPLPESRVRRGSAQHGRSDRSPQRPPDAVVSPRCMFWHAYLWLKVQSVLMEDEIGPPRCSWLCLWFAPSILQTCLLIESKHICDPCRGHVSNCSLQDCWRHVSCTAEPGCTGSLIETDSSVPFDKKVWKCLGLNTNWMHLFLNIFQLSLLFVPSSLMQPLWMMVSLLPLRWWWTGAEV